VSAPLVSVVVLAAGMSTRMDGAHKLTLDVAGEPMVRRTVHAVVGIAPVETIIVTGFAAEAVQKALAGLDVRFIHNADYANGQPGSVAAGVKSLRNYCHAVMIVPGDQPLLTTANLKSLVTAYATCGRSILIPFHNAQRGNPVIFATHFIPQVVSGGVNMGCRRLIETNGADVAQVEFPSDSFITDCDTPADYAAIIAHFATCHTRESSPDAI
jgi:molybdenum cofactor cytidylyltransferase